MKMYGNIINRIQEEAISKTPEIGMGVTEYLWSDRNAYEIIEVKNEKHFIMRKYTAKHIGPYGSQNWELISDENNATLDMVYRYGSWYSRITYTKESIEKALKRDGYVLLDEKTINKAMNDGVAYKYNKMNIVIGVADYYYDFEF
jgi:hypothetical protein